jgi:hypothetical protein
MANPIKKNRKSPKKDKSSSSSFSVPLDTNKKLYNNPSFDFSLVFSGEPDMTMSFTYIEVPEKVLEPDPTLPRVARNVERARSGYGGKRYAFRVTTEFRSEKRN